MSESKELNTEQNEGTEKPLITPIVVAAVSAYLDEVILRLPKKLQKDLIEVEGLSTKKAVEVVLVEAREIMESDLKLQSGVEMFTESRQKQIQSYINVFRNSISQHVDEEVGHQISVSAFNGGIVFKFDQGMSIGNTDNFIGVFPSLSEVFEILKIDQFKNSSTLEASVKNNKAPSEETAYFFANANFFLIKGLSEENLSKDQAKKDVNTIVSHMRLVKEKHINFEPTVVAENKPTV